MSQRKIDELTVHGSNYLISAHDVEFYLSSKGLSATIVPRGKTSGPLDEYQAKTIFFLCHHLNKDINNEYLTERDPLVQQNSL